MEETLINKSFDQLDENDLATILKQVARRILILRYDTPDAIFWHSTLMRVNKWLSTEPVVDDVEKHLLLDPPTTISGRVRAMRHMRERSGMQLHACKEIVDAWIKENLDLVHDTVKASYLSYEKNRTNTTVGAL